MFSRARRWLRPPRTLRPTRAGWSFFALCFGVGFAALNTGNNLLYLVLALMLSFLVLSGVLSEMALRGIRVRRVLPDELFARRPARIALEIHNDQRRFAAFAIVVEDRVAGAEGEDRGAGRCVALRVAAQGRELRSYGYEPLRRGALDFRGFVVSTRFPFGLFTKSLLLEAPEQALVYPAVERVAAPGERPAPDAEGVLAHPRDGSGDAADALREFSPGDPARRIHWRASARARRLLVRRRTSDQPTEIQVELARSAGESPEHFERRVSRAASEVVAGLAAGHRVGLRAAPESIDAASGARQRTRLLAFLARVQAPGAAA